MFFLITSNVKLLYSLLLSNVKTTNNISIPTQILSRHIFLTQTIQFQHISNLNASAKEISIFQNPPYCAIEELPSNLQLQMTNLQCKDMLKGKYQESNRILSSRWWICPIKIMCSEKSYACGLLVFGSTSLCEKTFFKDDIRSYVKYYRFQHTQMNICHQFWQMKVTLNPNKTLSPQKNSILLTDLYYKNCIQVLYFEFCQ